MTWWIQAARLRTLPLATATVLFGAAGIDWNSRNTAVVVLAWLTAITLQIFSNFANDWGDYKNGADNEKRIGPTRVMQSGQVSSARMKKALILLGVLAFLLGVLLLVISLLLSDHFIAFAVFLFIGISAIWAAYSYTAGKNPYGYKGLGDVFVFLFFGLASPVGLFYLLRFSVSWELLLRVGFVGVACVMVLHLNNMRDRQTDEDSNKKTLAVWLGFKKSKILHCIYICICLLSASGLSFTAHFSKISLLFLLFSLLWLLVHGFIVLKVKSEKEFDSQLKWVALSTFVSSILFLFC